MKDRNYRELDYWQSWTRRGFLKKVGTWTGAGLLQPVLSLVGAGKTIEAAYPEEILSIEKYTKGRVKPGMIISKDNAELVKDIASGGLYAELKRGREIMITETTRTPESFIPAHWIEATLRNKGQARLDGKGQLFAKDGEPWIGGDPFPEPKTGLEVIWNQVFNFEKYDDIFRPYSHEIDIDSNGSVVRKTIAFFITIYTNGRQVVEPKPAIPAYKDELFRITLTELYPFDIYGLALTNTVYYDASKLPDTVLYIPTLRRTRRVPSTQRFEPPRPGATYFVSDISLHSDPVLTWTWELSGKKPMLAPSPANLGTHAKDEKKDAFTFPMVDTKYVRTSWELRPEIIFLDGTPHLPGAPYSRKRIYFDAVLGRAAVADFWDLQKLIWKYSAFFAGNLRVKDGRGRDVKSLSGLYYANVQTDYHTYVWIHPEGPTGKFAVNTGLKIEDHSTPSAMLSRARR